MLRVLEVPPQAILGGNVDLHASQLHVAHRGDAAKLEVGHLQQLVLGQFGHLELLDGDHYEGVAGGIVELLGSEFAAPITAVQLLGQLGVQERAYEISEPMPARNPMKSVCCT